MPTISLKIHIVKSNDIKTMQFEESMIVYDACRLIRERVSDAAQRQPNEYGLFKPDEDPTKGHWLEQGRTLEYYHLKSGDILEYRKKQRPLRVRTLDGTVKTLLVDDSQTVAELTKQVCARIGLSNPEEFAFTSEEEIVDIVSRRQQYHARDQKKLDTLKKKLHTDDELNWLNPDKSLREQGIEETAVLTLRKKFFFSDQNVDRNDPVQLNLLFVQSRDAIIDGTHPCTREEAIQFAALQCQVQYGNHNEAKHKPGFITLEEFLPREYAKLKGLEKLIFAEHRKLYNLSEINAKFRYIQLCRSLRTYGVTFFLVKEKMHGRNKLVPRLLGITRESIIRVDETTKEVLKTWPLTTVRCWGASPNAFTLDFGDYSESFYSVQTTEGKTISQLISGYIDIIMQKKKPRHVEVPDDEDEPVIVDFEVDPKKASMTTFTRGGHGYAEEEGLAGLGVLQQAGSDEGARMSHGEMAQHGEMMGAPGIKHQPPSMSDSDEYETMEFVYPTMPKPPVTKPKPVAAAERPPVSPSSTPPSSPKLRIVAEKASVVRGTPVKRGESVATSASTDDKQQLAAMQLSINSLKTAVGTFQANCDKRFSSIQDELIRMAPIVDNLSKQCSSSEEKLKQLKQLVMATLKQQQHVPAGPKIDVSAEEQNRTLLRSLTHIQVFELLAVMNLHQYQDTFKSEEIDGEVLAECDEAVLEHELGMTSRLHRLRLMKLITGQSSAALFLESQLPYDQIKMQ